MPPHELRSFGRGCRRIGSKPEMPLCERAPKRHPDFAPAWLVVFADFGVNLVSNIEKVMILDKVNACKPLILAGLQKKSKNISTHLLLVLKEKGIVI